MVRHPMFPPPLELVSPTSTRQSWWQSSYMSSKRQTYTSWIPPIVIEKWPIPSMAPQTNLRLATRRQGSTRRPSQSLFLFRATFESSHFTLTAWQPPTPSGPTQSSFWNLLQSMNGQQSLPIILSSSTGKGLRWRQGTTFSGATGTVISY